MGFLFAIGREAPCGPSGRLRVRMRARRVGVRGRVQSGPQCLWPEKFAWERALGKPDLHNKNHRT